MAIADILCNMNLFVDGRSYAGKVAEITLPKIAPKLQEYQAGGMSAAIDIPMGVQEKMEADFTLKAFDTDLLKLFRVVLGESPPMTVRGAVTDGDGTKHKIVVTMRGPIKEYDMGTWKPGEEATLKIGVTLHYYKLERDGDTLIESDPENMVLVVDGVDRQADMRAALGI